MLNTSDKEMISNDCVRWGELNGIYGGASGLYATLGDTMDGTTDE